VQIVVAWSADRYNARALHVCAFSLIGAVGYIVSATAPATDFKTRYGMLIMALAGAFATIPPLLGWLTSNLFSTASVGLAVAINVSLGAGFGQIGSVWIYKDAEKKRGYPSGHWTNAAMLLFMAVTSLLLRFYYVQQNKRILREANGMPARLFKL
jgi:hypothetical protein